MRGCDVVKTDKSKATSCFNRADGFLPEAHYELESMVTCFVPTTKYYSYPKVWLRPAVA